MDFERLLPLLRCPQSATVLKRVGDELVSAAGFRYPIVNGKPVLVKLIQPMHVSPPGREIVSQNIQNFRVKNPRFGDEAVILHLGSGNVPSDDQRVISMDILPTDNVDLVAEAEALPFASNTLDLVVSGAVFEHLYDPMQAIREVRRVLKEGGMFNIDTAFMQSYHGFPSHYFNMTPQAVETLLVDDFKLEQSLVPESGTMLESFIGTLDRFLGLLPAAERKSLLKLSFAEALDRMRKERGRANPLLHSMSEYAHRAMAASFVVVALKPVDYERRQAAVIEELGEPAWNALKREYYAARMGLMLRHHEVELYRQFTRDARGLTAEDMAAPPPLESYLSAAAVEDSLSPEAFRVATALLRSQQDGLTVQRDHWIDAYLKASTLVRVNQRVSTLLGGLPEGAVRSFLEAAFQSVKLRARRLIRGY